VSCLVECCHQRSGKSWQTSHVAAKPLIFVNNSMDIGNHTARTYELMTLVFSQVRNQSNEHWNSIPQIQPTRGVSASVACLSCLGCQIAILHSISTENLLNSDKSA
jgi:hypothetical protein